MNKNSDKNLFKKKFSQLSNTNLYLRGISSSTNKTNNHLFHKDSSKTNYPNKKLQINILNKFNIKSNSQSIRPFKLFYTEKKLNNTKSPKMKLKTTIIKSYNSNLKHNNKPNISLLKTDYFKKNNFIKLKKLEKPDNKQKTPSDSLSKSSDKSSSIFLTSNQNNNNLKNNQKYRGIQFKGSSHNIVDNFGNLVDPIIIPEEDKIFDELKKIDSLTERFKRKNKNNPIYKSKIKTKIFFKF